jgi:mono/diheme cytochrome c family protein
VEINTLLAIRVIGTAAALALTACGHDMQPANTHNTVPAPGETSGMMGRSGMPMMGGQGFRAGPADTGAAPRATAHGGQAPGCPVASQPVVDAGRAIFTGTGHCYACHGSDAHGTALAPSLRDATWLDTDGSYAGIAALVRVGVSQPKQFPAAMPAQGGATLDAGQICDVAAYVYSLTH